MRFVPAAALLATALVAGCDVADMNPMASPSRPQVTVEKEVSMVSEAELVGTWSCRELNPYPDQPTVTTTLDLSADGTMMSEAILPMPAEMAATGDMMMTMTGDWQVEGDRLVTSNTESEFTSADGGAQGLSAMMDSMAAFFADRGDSNAEIFRVTATELVMRGDAEDAPTVACTRQT